jgi:hypothetical protein
VYGGQPLPGQQLPAGQPMSGQPMPGQSPPTTGTPLPGRALDDTGSFSMENSGSLTGAILARGRPDTPDGNRSHTSKAVIISLILVGVVVIAAVAGVIAILSGMLKG